MRPLNMLRAGYRQIEFGGLNRRPGIRKYAASSNSTSVVFEAGHGQLTDMLLKNNWEA